MRPTSILVLFLPCLPVTMPGATEDDLINRPLPCETRQIVASMPTGCDPHRLRG